MRVGIVALLQESNSFAPALTTLNDFEADMLLTGESMRRALEDAPHEVGGFFAGLAQAKIEAVPIMAARAIPWGPISSTTYIELCKRLFRAIAEAGPLDGVLVAAHGATTSEEIDDVDGHWLTELRKQVGPAIPIIGTLDLHANLSSKMVQACDGLIAYRTNPHLDQRNRGLEAAALIGRALRGEIWPRQAAAFPPLSINIECQHSSESPCRELLQRIDKLHQQPGVLSASVLLGFPYADVAEMGAATIVITDDSLSDAQRKADSLARWIWEHREQFVRRPVSINESITRAAKAIGPVCLLDVGDNIGGGSPGDATHLGHALRKKRIGPSLVCLHDPKVVHQAKQSGIGTEIEADIGGKSCTLSGTPLRGTFRVKGIFSGKFVESEPRHGGFKEFDQGLTAVLESNDGLTIVAMSRRTPPYSLMQLKCCNLDPTQFRVIIAKGVHAPVAAYREVCREFIRVDTPGVTTADISRLRYTRRRIPLYPLEQNTSWE